MEDIIKSAKKVIDQQGRALQSQGEYIKVLERSNFVFKAISFVFVISLFGVSLYGVLI